MSSTKIELKKELCYKIPETSSLQNLDSIISDAKFPQDWLITLAGYRVSLSNKLPPEEKMDPATIYLVEEQKTKTIAVYVLNKDTPPKLVKRTQIESEETTEQIKQACKAIRTKEQDSNPRSRASSHAEAAKLCGEVASLCGFTSQEIGLAVPLSGLTELFPTDKKSDSEVEKQLKFIYLLWNDRIPKKICSDNERASIRSDIQEDFDLCKDGRKNRISKVVLDFMVPQGILGLLHSMREGLVQTAANELKVSETHTRRYVSKVAAKQYGVECPNQGDVYGLQQMELNDQKIEATLSQIFEAEYTLPGIFAAFRNKLAKLCNYRGEASGNGYTLGEYSAVLNYLVKIFGEEAAAIETIRNKYLLMDEDDVVRDLNWSAIHKRLWELLVPECVDIPDDLKSVLSYLINRPKQEAKAAKSEDVRFNGDFVSAVPFLFKTPSSNSSDLEEKTSPADQKEEKSLVRPEITAISSHYEDFIRNIPLRRIEDWMSFVSSFGLTQQESCELLKHFLTPEHISFAQICSESLQLICPKYLSEEALLNQLEEKFIRQAPDPMSKYQALLDIAIQLNWTKVVEIVVKNKKIPDLDALNRQGDTPLLKAARAGHYEMVELLLEHGADPAFPDQAGNTPLIFAAHNGHTKAVRHLLENKNKALNVDARNNLGSTALLSAAAKGRHEIISLLINYGAGPDLADEKGQTPLMWAVHAGHQQVVEKLLKSKEIEIDAKNRAGETALLVALKKGSQKIVELLLDYGADPNVTDRQGETFLAWASFKGHTEVVRALLKSGKIQNIDAKDRWGETALSYAVSDRNLNMVQLLIEYNANPMVGGFIRRPWKWVIDHNEVEIFRHLLSSQQLAADRHEENMSEVLSYAVFHQKPQIVQLLLEQGANPNLRDIVMKDTVLGVALYHQDLATIQLLLKYGADPNLTITCDYWTPLCRTVHREDWAAMRLLLEYGASPSRKNSDGHVSSNYSLYDRKISAADYALLREYESYPALPLCKAAEQGNAKKMAHLLRLGIDVRGKNQHKEMALDIAKKHNKRSVIQAIYDHLCTQMIKAKSEADTIALFSALNVDIQTRNSQGKTLLEVAIQHQKVQVYCYLQQFVSTVDPQSDSKLSTAQGAQPQSRLREAKLSHPCILDPGFLPGRRLELEDRKIDISDEPIEDKKASFIPEEPTDSKIPSGVKKADIDVMAKQLISQLKQELDNKLNTNAAFTGFVGFFKWIWMLITDSARVLSGEQIARYETTVKYLNTIEKVPFFDQGSRIAIPESMPQDAQIRNKLLPIFKLYEIGFNDGLRPVLVPPMFQPEVSFLKEAKELKDNAPPKSEAQQDDTLDSKEKPPTAAEKSDLKGIAAAAVISGGSPIHTQLPTLLVKQAKPPLPVTRPVLLQ